MRIDAIPIGKNPPDDVNVIVEVPIGGEPIKYEMDKDAGHAGRRPLPLHADALSRELRLHPAHAQRRWRPDRRAGRQYAARSCPGAVINVRPVGVLKMEDDGGGDEKIIAVPSPKLTQRYEHVTNYTHLPQITHRADPALLRALQGPGARQVGEGPRLGRRGGGQAPDHGGDRPPLGEQRLTPALRFHNPTALRVASATTVCNGSPRRPNGPASSQQGKVKE